MSRNDVDAFWVAEARIVGRRQERSRVQDDRTRRCRNEDDEDQTTRRCECPGDIGEGFVIPRQCPVGEVVGAHRSWPAADDQVGSTGQVAPPD
ncbi:MAG TPA: hypothetical protein VHN80_05800, partial [Kineosporiaceae bacterium]|nr:hypothetical protein [Kineosporiaceae bacterium]